MAGESSSPLRRVLHAAELRRVHLAFLSFSLSEHATWLAVLFYALQRGGPREVGVVAVVQLVPGVLLTPFSAYAGDRFDPRLALTVGYTVQSLMMTAAAVAMSQGWWLAAYAAATGAATAVCFTRPVMGALLPTVTRSPEDLVAANVVVGLIEQVGVFAGPIAGAAVMAASSPSRVFLLAAALTVAGAAVTATLLRVPGTASNQAKALRPGEVARELLAGFSALRRTPLIRVLLVFLAVAGLVKGIGDVIFVTFADIRLDGTELQAGLMAGGYGLGGLFGAASVTSLVRGRRVGGQLLAAGLVLAGGLLMLAAVAEVLPAVVGFACIGGAESALGLAATVSIQRVAPTTVLARVFGIVEAVQMGCIAVGSLVITVLVAQLDLGDAFSVLAAGLAGVVVIGVLLLSRHGAQLAPVASSVLERLSADPVLAPLPPATLERLGRGVSSFRIPSGTSVVRQGDRGDRYYVILDGTFDVSIDGRTVRILGPADSFGELALLRDVPRSATVTASADAELLAIGREPFLEAVTGHSRSLTAANRMTAVPASWPPPRPGTSVRP